MIKVDFKKYDNSWYKPGSKIKILIWYFVNVLFFINPLNPISSLKVFLLRLFGAKIGSNVVFKPGVSVKYPWFLEIGNSVWVGESVWIDNLTKITIEDNVCLSQGAMLLCGNHNYKKSSFDLKIGEIKLEEGSWVGAKSVVCPGVTLKTHAILAVNSVATSDLEAYSIYQGNPAIKTRKRNLIE
ncbi:WcaF family extracellular polysaccharide biosynthesis acetyltransferase [Polaribacter sargassicola]|uniref:WcaF family extracellular polysaccharide biosynthesis acetyltransferase n=1 Tax=Polaribacter sargassicola TaxID=2836891 RepID=UPI001F45D717|nr:WcaF family extracellular polysaccharide biosynthesis acetyltransferase [Polaribacter sp. DS7-9]MCG1036553.1 WcaF family extracellular polysaccharide biosynthesis acetyltransferase [Polaribacter sp. DS7-9]